MKNHLHNLLTLLLVMVLGTGLSAQCTDNIIANGGFEAGSTSDWWNWHDNSPDAYTFATSDDAYAGDSSAQINILVDTDLIPGGQGAEYNSRPQTNPVIGGEYYEIGFWAKSTLPNTKMPFYIKDENDGWILLHQGLGEVGTDWTWVSSIWQADIDRADVHLEIKVYNGDIHEPYSVWIDEVSVCGTMITTLTCPDNLVANPGFEDGADVDWWTWHSNNELAYSFETGAEGFRGNSSALLRVLESTANITGPGEFNSRPQESPVVAGQNYKVSLYGKSTLDNTIVQVWVKDEFDGWTTIGNADVTFGTDWSEQSFIFTADVDRSDVHIELKVFNADFTEAYDVWMDEVSICKTEEDPNTGEPTEPVPPIFGTTVGADCSSNLAPGYDGFEDPENLGWDIWDGSDDEELATFVVDAVLPNSGSNSMRLDITENHNTAEFHHRFGDRFELLDGEDYIMTMWIRSNVEDGDTVHVLARGVRDTDWASQFGRDLYITSNDWLNFNLSFTADGTWDNVFLEYKAWRLNDAFQYPYSIWYDDIEICHASDGTVGLNDFEDLGLTFNLSPNPVSTSQVANLEIASLDFFKNTNITLIDMLGRTHWVQQMDIDRGIQNVAIPTDGLQSGIYLVQIRQDEHVKNLKMQVINQ